MAGPTIDPSVKNQRAHERNLKRKEERRKSAELRQQAYNKLSVTQKLAKLDSRLGNSQGAVKERIKLLAKQENKELAS